MNYSVSFSNAQDYSIGYINGDIALYSDRQAATKVLTHLTTGGTSYSLMIGNTTYTITWQKNGTLSIYDQADTPFSAFLTETMDFFESDTSKLFPITALQRNLNRAALEIKKATYAHPNSYFESWNGFCQNRLEGDFRAYKDALSPLFKGKLPPKHKLLGSFMHHYLTDKDWSQSANLKLDKILPKLREFKLNYDGNWKKDIENPWEALNKKRPVSLMALRIVLWDLNGTTMRDDFLVQLLAFIKANRIPNFFFLKEYSTHTYETRLNQYYADIFKALTDKKLTGLHLHKIPVPAKEIAEMVTLFLQTNPQLEELCLKDILLNRDQALALAIQNHSHLKKLVLVLDDINIFANFSNHISNTHLNRLKIDLCRMKGIKNQTILENINLVLSSLVSLTDLNVMSDVKHENNINKESTENLFIEALTNHKKLQKLQFKNISFSLNAIKKIVMLSHEKRLGLNFNTKSQEPHGNEVYVLLENFPKRNELLQELDERQYKKTLGLFIELCACLKDIPKEIVLCLIEALICLTTQDAFKTVTQFND